MSAQEKAAGALATPEVDIHKVRSAHYPLPGDSVQAFRAAMAAAGIEPPAEVIADGRLHRFSANGKRTDDADWYILHGDSIPAGVFGCWRTGLMQTWSARGEYDLSPVERAALAHRITAMKLTREREQRQRADRAANAAAVRWAAALSVTCVSNASECQGHPYLSAKGIQAHGVRIEGGHTLLVPMRDTDGRLHGLQGIAPDGTKRFMPSQRVQGCYHAIGKLTGKLAICEGYATGATLYEEGSMPVAVAFNAGNLLAVARALRAKYPDTALTVCADDDWQTEGNPGLSKAGEAAAAVGAKLAVPDFAGLPRGDKDTDFNDLARLHRQAGKGAV
jgi:putative DNA primase/helicase